MMIKRVSLWLLATVFLTAVSFADAQQSRKVYRVGRLSGSLSSSTFSLDALRRELRELGYVEGKNIAFELRYAEEKPERLPALADELVRLKVDLIIAGGPNDGLAAKKATKTIPIVFTDSVSDPVARGLVDSLARPGGNVTGFFTMADVLAGKRLEVLKECHSQTLARRCLVVPKVWEQRAAVDRKPTRRPATWVATLLHGDRQHRQV